MDQEKLQELFEEKYQARLGISYAQWMETGPENENQAYERLAVINEELKQTEDEWREAQGDSKDQLETYREKLRLEYELIESMFGLESDDE